MRLVILYRGLTCVDMCVVFDGNADALNKARDNEMKSVGMTCVYPSYELLAADMTARNF